MDYFYPLSIILRLFIEDKHLDDQAESSVPNSLLLWLTQSRASSVGLSTLSHAGPLRTTSSERSLLLGEGPETKPLGGKLRGLILASNIHYLPLF